MDAHLLESGHDFDELPVTYVIFIAEEDVIGSDLPLYTIDRVVRETGGEFGDEAHIVYVNGENKDANTALGRLMHDFFCTNPNDMHYELLADKVRYFKESEEGIATMCRSMEDKRNETADGERMSNALEMLADGVPLRLVAQYSELPIERVCELAATKLSS